MAENKGGGAVSVSHGEIWFIGWLFTIAYAHLAFWKAVFALIIWPYFLGVTIGAK